MMDLDYHLRIVGANEALAPTYIESVLEAEIAAGSVTVTGECGSCWREGASRGPGHVGEHVRAGGMLSKVKVIEYLEKVLVAIREVKEDTPRDEALREGGVLAIEEILNTLRKAAT